MYFVDISFFRKDTIKSTSSKKKLFFFFLLVIVKIYRSRTTFLIRHELNSRGIRSVGTGYRHTRKYPYTKVSNGRDVCRRKTCPPVVNALLPSTTGRGVTDCSLRRRRVVRTIGYYCHRDPRDANDAAKISRGTGKSLMKINHETTRHCPSACERHRVIIIIVLAVNEIRRQVTVGA